MESSVTIICDRAEGISNVIKNMEFDIKVGFIGFGNVGAKLSGSLLRNGVDLTVCDLNEALISEFEERGAKPGQSSLRLCRFAIR